MCGRIVRERIDYGRRFGFDEESSTRLGDWWVDRHNIAPTQRDVFGGPRETGTGRPRWDSSALGEGPERRAKMFNARAEMLHERSAFGA
jgi:putative SOS response-associated peptidase YedK